MILKRNCVMILHVSFIIIKRKACQYARTVGRVGTKVRFALGTNFVRSMLREMSE